MSQRPKYGLMWDDDLDDAQIERQMLRWGGKVSSGGVDYGLGLIPHFKNYWSLLWPEDSQTWWTDLILDTVIKRQFTSLVGPASSWKSGTISRIAMMDWSVFPECTSVIMSSTTLEGLRSRIYGETTMMWKRAKERYDWFPGNPVDSKTVITNANVEEDKARDIRNSILGVACKTSSGVFVGMGSYSGRKNRRVWCLGDEFQFMMLSILQAQDNLISNDDGTGGFGGLYPNDYQDPRERGLPRRHYRCVFIGNTNPSVRDNPLDVVSEPEGGWPSIDEAVETHGKTQVWKCKQLQNHPVQCYCVNLDALDGPNSGFPIDKPRYAQLAGPHKVRKYVVGSESYWSNGRGRFKFGLDQFKIITKEICERFRAFDSVQWEGSPRTKIGMLDASYSGDSGDRCALGWLEFGKCSDGKMRIMVHPFWLVPVKIMKDFSAEDQIATFCKMKMQEVGVAAENFVFDGRGALAVSFGRIWSTAVNVVEFGGSPTERVAGPDIWTNDLKTGLRRPKRSDEHYRKFVSELWWSWRYIVEADQMRGLPIEIALDAQPREWRKVAGDKIEIETKKELKERTGISPDLADMLVAGIEGARRRGFELSSAAQEREDKSDDSWYEKEQQNIDKSLKTYTLAHGSQAPLLS